MTSEIKNRVTELVVECSGNKCPNASEKTVLVGRRLDYGSFSLGGLVGALQDEFEIWFPEHIQDEWWTIGDVVKSVMFYRKKAGIQ